MPAVLLMRKRAISRPAPSNLACRRLFTKRGTQRMLSNPLAIRTWNGSGMTCRYTFATGLSTYLSSLRLKLNIASLNDSHGSYCSTSAASIALSVCAYRRIGTTYGVCAEVGGGGAGVSSTTAGSAGAATASRGAVPAWVACRPETVEQPARRSATAAYAPMPAHPWPMPLRIRRTNGLPWSCDPSPGPATTIAEDPSVRDLKSPPRERLTAIHGVVPGRRIA